MTNPSAVPSSPPLGVSKDMEALVEDVIGHAAIEMAGHLGSVIGRNKLKAATPVAAKSALLTAIAALETERADYRRQLDDTLADYAHYVHEVPQWRDIATAPKNGTLVDLWTTNGRISDASWSSNNTWRIWGVDDFNSPGWQNVIAHITHWMPLPPSPTGSTTSKDRLQVPDTNDTAALSPQNLHDATQTLHKIATSNPDMAKLEGLLDHYENMVHRHHEDGLSSDTEVSMDVARTAIHVHVAAVVQAEREACANIADEYILNPGSLATRVAAQIKDRICARSTTPTPPTDARPSQYDALLDAHRNFHNTVACPGLPECLVCQLEDTIHA